MTVWRWRTSGVPSWDGGRPETAFMPLVTKTIGVWQSFKELVSGQPGTMPVPAPPHDLPSDRLAPCEGQAYARDFGGSWFPQIWYQENFSTWFGARDAATGTADFAAGVAVHSDNQLPVPAIEPMRGTRRLGGGMVTPVYQQPGVPARPARRVARRHA